MTGGGGHSELGEFGEEDLRGDSVEHQTEVQEQDLCVRPWGVKVLKDAVQSYVDCIIH